MHRVGALASLTANYTDSDASDEDRGQGNEDEDGPDGAIGLMAGPHLNIHNLRVSSVVNPAPFTVSPGQLNIANVVDADSQQGMPTTMSIDEPQLGHITDEDQSDRSDELSEDETDTKDIIIDETDLNDIQIPPEPSGRCSNHLQEKFTQYYERMLREGLDLNATIQNQKQFRNPSIYEKLIQFCQIDELGTNYTPGVYDPGQFQNGPFYEDLAKAQKIEMDKRMKDHKDRTKIEFVTGTAKKSSSSASSTFDDEGKRRKSKWDVGAAIVGPPVGQQPGLIPVASVASGTKAMVISAFGTIAKKSKP